MKPKRPTKEQRREREIAALEQYDEMETPWMLAEHLHDMGIRA